MMDVSIDQRFRQLVAPFAPACSWEAIWQEAEKALYPGISEEETFEALLLATRCQMEKDPDYQWVAARFLLEKIYAEISQSFSQCLQKGIEEKRYTPELEEFDWQRLEQALVAERDYLFRYQGLQILYDRYLLKERPQYFWMRVAMGLAVQEENKDERAIEFYHVLSQHLFISSTPTLFHAGTCHPQLSSCYISTVEDDLKGIFKAISDNALLSKWAAGLGNDWTNIRAIGSKIHGTGGTSQGVVPFLKVANDTALAVNQGGKRKGVACAYLETWHRDIEDFLELRKNTGDDRRRTHDMNTANWIPDLFMKRVKEDLEWTLFDPAAVPDLHGLYGLAFEKQYEHYEQTLTQGKRVSARTLWKKMLTMLFETGHPWITFKDPCNIRSAQDHVGVIYSSNLCTEIVLNTSKEEVAVCNLGSLNLAKHISEGELDIELLKQTTRTAMRMLDNVIDINFYPIPEAKNSNLRHRPVGLGMMGFQDALYACAIDYASEAAVNFADMLTELISFYAIEASSDLAKERGRYSSYRGSKWDRGLLPIDTIDLLEQERGIKVSQDRSHKLDWAPLREKIATQGMRNCQVLAIAPNATTAQILGVTQSIEPMYANLFSKSNLSGEFVWLNPYLVSALKEKQMWTPKVLEELKYYDGSIQEIELPESIKKRFLTAFEIDSQWIISAASRRMKWIDQSQSLNLYIANPSGKQISDMYFRAWEMGLKTCYYLRSQAATRVEKSTVDINAKSIQPRWMKHRSASSAISVQRACALDDPTCESCQ
ncbi:MAG: ribonucleoside-diphosphate reductase subunit alpha [Chlamydiia bacterium]|nr:ribonucleoside-diphosphate reductase subunit alpha [Chlamydiia bacterium]